MTKTAGLTKISSVLHSHLLITSVGRPGHCQSPVLAVENVDVRQLILFDVPPDGVHVS